jgi:hypothetical protein
MRDLLVIVPSRGRPERLWAMIEACLSLSEADTDIAVGIDSDDPAAARYEEIVGAYHFAYQGGVFCTKAERRTLGAWTNRIAAANTGEYRAFASLGDDHVPRTAGWDGLLLEALDNLNDYGEGIAYGNDLHQGEALPTAPVISAGIVSALGWMMEPGLKHMHVDDGWRDLGQAAGCLAYVPEVIIEHQHPDAGKAVSDETYTESAAGLSGDRDAYHRWRNERMAGDVAKVRALLERRA